ncbi:MAG: anaerobic ribonucleoside-triphosphate reductase activating protein [Bacilli bacterium]|nr:anaerobic ribonucleoside-triphosphate reductase activating protein [Bacilli bacterium]
MNKIYGLEKMSLVDFDGHLCATIFLASCNFRCPFCHNSSLVLDTDKLIAYDEKEIFSYLEKRRGMLDAVCITGGEPTLSANLEEIIDKIKALGYLVKLDSNGTRPEILKKLIDEKKVDYIAMDVKSGSSNYAKVAGIVNEKLIEKVKESIELLKKANINYEFRTTLVKELHTMDDIYEIGELIKGAKKFYFQRFTDHGECIEDGFSEVDIDTANKYLEIIKKYVPNAALRGY